MPIGIYGRTMVDKICEYKPCSKSFKLPKGLRNICCSKECGDRLRGERLHNSNWIWGTNKKREKDKQIARAIKEEKELHLKTIFCGGYSKEDSLILYDYSEGEIL
jgi:hypothetical protein